MSNSIIWEPLLKRSIKRGDVIDGRSNQRPIDSEGYLNYWTKVAELILLLALDNEKIKIETEVWLDTGRIITMISDKLEFSRVCLKVDSIEEKYYELPDDDEPCFDDKYNELFSMVKSNIKKAFISVGFEDVSLESAIIRDSDDSTTNDILADLH